MQLDPARARLRRARRRRCSAAASVDAGKVADYAEAIATPRLEHAAAASAVLRADDFLPEKSWHVLASIGYMCDDPYTGAPGVDARSPTASTG